MRIRFAATMVCLVLASNCAYVARVSLSDNELQPNNFSSDVSLSGDGRFAAFASEATNLIAGDTNGVKDVFVRDNQAGTTELISISTGGGAADDFSSQPRISPDGRFVVFWSYATNLVVGDTNGQSDVFVHDRNTGAIERVSVDDSGGQLDAGTFGGDISDDGTQVVFYTLADIAPTDSNGDFDVYLHSRSAGTTTLVSRTAGGSAAGTSYEPKIGPNGDIVAWDSFASNLVAGDNNGVSDVFVRSMAAGVTISPSSGGNGPSNVGDITGYLFDGAVTFSSAADNLVAGDANGVRDIFVFRTLNLGSSLERITDMTTAANEPSLSANGNGVAFSSGGNIYLWVRFTGTKLMSATSFGDPIDGVASGPSVSADATAVAYMSSATNTGFSDTNGVSDVVVHRTSRPSVASITGELAAGVATPITISGSFRTGDQLFLEGNGIVDITIDSLSSTTIQATIEIAAGTPTDDLRYLWVVRSSPALGINYPLGAADRGAVYLRNGG